MVKLILNVHLSLVLFLFLSCTKKAVEEVPSTSPSPTLSLPNKPVVTNPVSLNALTNSDLTINGSCETGAMVTLAGDSSQNTTCVSTLFSFTVSKTTSGNYFLNIFQTNTAGSSGLVNVSWTLDNNAPPLIILTSPLSNPYTSGDSTISISGQCETGATVNISGDYTNSVSCINSIFNFNNVNQGADGTYTFNLIQTDAALNISSPLVFTWIKDTTIPPTPTITNFTDNPHYTNFSPMNVQGACVAGNTVNIEEAGVSLASGACSVSGTYSLNISKGTNGNFSLYVYQIDSVNLIESAHYDFNWIYDTVVPSIPTIQSPIQSPETTSSLLVISGQCENNATVHLTGANTSLTVCTSNAYSFTVSQTVDGLYNYAINQTDLALNTSGSVSQSWIRDSFALPTPIITNPIAQPYISNASQLNLNGTCETGLTVRLTGVSSADVIVPASSLDLVCADSSFAYTITKPDGTYTLSLYQTNGVSNSATANKTWTKDTVEPNTTVTSQPPSTNYSIISSFAFSSNESSIIFQCSLDGSPYSTCTTPLNYTNLINGSHTLNIRAVDAANNIDSSPATYTWIQEAFNAIALYHFNSTAPLSDSGGYSGGVKNDLTDNSSASTAGKFSEAQRFNTTGNYVFTVDTPSQNVITSYLTLEGFVRLNALPGSYGPVVSKINTATSKASFEYGIRKQGSKYYIYFRGSLNGTTYTEIKSAALTAAEQALLTTGFNHVAVTWNLGSVKYYFNGVSKGTGSIGTVGTSKLAISIAPLRIGYNGSTTLNGSTDEVRISQKVRWSTNFTPPASEYIAD